MKLLLILLAAIMLMGCGSEKESANTQSGSETSEKEERAARPDIPESLPPNTARVLLSIQGSGSMPADSLQLTEATVNEFMESGSSTPVLTQGERITLKISSASVRNHLRTLWEKDPASPAEAIIKFTPTVTLSSEKDNQDVWSLIQLNASK